MEAPVAVLDAILHRMMERGRANIDELENQERLRRHREAVGVGGGRRG